MNDSIQPCRVAFVQFTTPASYPPIMNASRILAKAGCQIELWGIEGEGDASKLSMEPDERMSVRLLPYVRPGWRQKVQYLQFGWLCFIRTLFLRPRFIYASDLLAFPISYFLSMIPGVQVIAHEHDTPKPTGRRLDRLYHWARTRLLRRATVTVIPQKDRAELVAKEVRPRKIQVVWNCPRREEIIPLCANPSKEECVLWYHGSLSKTQFPETLVVALSQLPNRVRLKFAGYETIGQRGYIEHLRKLAEDLGIASRFEYVGTKATRKELFLAASQCDIGFALFDRQFREAMVGASNKPFDYLACGLAVITTDTEEWKSFFQGCPSVEYTNPAQPSEIARTVSKLIADPQSFQQRRSDGQKLVETTWNYEKQFEPIMNLILATRTMHPVSSCQT